MALSYLELARRLTTHLAALKLFRADEYSEFTTNYNGGSYNGSFIDSGSNGLSFPASSQVATCTASEYATWYCPANLTNLSATMVGTNGTQAVVNFGVYRADVMLSNTNNIASPYLAGPMDGAFDWGFPFFFGRTVAVGIEGTSSNLGSDSYWAF